MNRGTREQRMKALAEVAEMADEIAHKTTDGMVSALAQCVVAIANVSRYEFERLEEAGAALESKVTTLPISEGK